MQALRSFACKGVEWWSHLTDGLVGFSQRLKSLFPSTEWKRPFSLLRLADMLGIDKFLAAVSREICI